VTEPTVSGFHDLERVYQLVKKFGIKAGCIINKADLNPAICHEIQSWIQAENIAAIAELPYDEEFTRAMTEGKTIMESESELLKSILTDAWQKIRDIL